MVAPQAAIYEAMVYGRTGGFYWEVTVDAASHVAELTVSLVREAGLEQTASLEILELDLSDGSHTWGEYVERLVIFDPGLLDDLLAALDTDLHATPIVVCIPEYTLRFRLTGGGIQEFSYGCDGASFLRGWQGFLWGKDFSPQQGFNALLRAQLATTCPQPSMWWSRRAWPGQSSSRSMKRSVPRSLIAQGSLRSRCPPADRLRFPGDCPDSRRLGCRPHAWSWGACAHAVRARVTPG